MEIWKMGLEEVGKMGVEKVWKMGVTEEITRNTGSASIYGDSERQGGRRHDAHPQAPAAHRR